MKVIKPIQKYLLQLFPLRSGQLAVNCLLEYINSKTNDELAENDGLIISCDCSHLYAVGTDESAFELEFYFDRLRGMFTHRLSWNKYGETSYRLSIAHPCNLGLRYWTLNDVRERAKRVSEHYNQVFYEYVIELIAGQLLQADPQLAVYIAALPCAQIPETIMDSMYAPCFFNSFHTYFNDQFEYGPVREVLLNLIKYLLVLSPDQVQEAKIFTSYTTARSKNFQFELVPYFHLTSGTFAWELSWSKYGTHVKCVINITMHLGSFTWTLDQLQTCTAEDLIRPFTSYYLTDLLGRFVRPIIEADEKLAKHLIALEYHTLY